MKQLVTEPLRAVAPRYEQVEGNKRYRCPACAQPAILSVRIGPRDHVCPLTGLPVTAVQVKAALEIGRA